MPSHRTALALTSTLVVTLLATGCGDGFDPSFDPYDLLPAEERMTPAGPGPRPQEVRKIPQQSRRRASARAGVPPRRIPTRAACPSVIGVVDELVTGLPILRGDLTFATDTARADLSDPGTVDHIYELIPSASTLYTFDLCDSAYNTLVTIRTGDCQNGTVLAANDDDCADRSRIEGVQLQQGVSYYVIVDGGRSENGVYELEITRTNSCQTPPEFIVDEATSPLPVLISGDTTGADDTSTLVQCDCLSGDTGGADHVIRFIPRSNSTYSFSLCGSSYDTQLAIRKGHCSNGEEVACNDQGAGCGDRSEIRGVPLVADVTYYVIVDGYSQAVADASLGFPGPTGPYELLISSSGTPSGCTTDPEQIIVEQLTPLPVTVTGTTTGATDDVGFTSLGSWASDGPDHVYEFRPASFGTYRFSLCGALYDTLLSIREGHCLAGPELATNDDSPECERNQSVVTTTLERNGSYFVIVDGYAGASGAYSLEISRVSGTLQCADIIQATLDEAMLPPLPYVTTGSTTGATDDIALETCEFYAPDGPDHVYEFIPAVSTEYTFSLCGSSYDTQLALRSQDCFHGPEIACNDQGATCLPSSELANVPLIAGQSYFVVVDGANGASGAYRLEISRNQSRPDCPSFEGTLDEAALGLPIVVEGDTTGASRTARFTGCNADEPGGADHVYELIPASTAAYTISLCSAISPLASDCLDGFDTQLSVRLGNCVNGPELACNDDGETCAPQSEIQGLLLTAGTPYFIVITGVDGTAGTYRLTIDSNAGTACPGVIEAVADEATMPLPYVHEGYTNGADATATPPSCGSTIVGAADHIVQFTAAANDTYTFSLCSSRFDTLLSVRTGCTTGVELACSDNAACGTRSQLDVALMPGMTVYAVITGSAGAEGYYQLEITRAGCQPGDVEEVLDEALVGPLPIVRMGDTTGASDTTITASCEFSDPGSADHVYQFIPAVTAAYDVSLCGSTFDTQLAVRVGDCKRGPELGCNDEAASCPSQSELLALDLVAGTSYFVIVDGYAMEQGAYTLTIDRTVVPLPPCTIEETLVEAQLSLPIVRMGDTTGADDSAQLEFCNRGGADHVYEFIPATSGNYTVSLCNGSAYDTLLAIREGGCRTGRELLCEDQGCGAGNSELVDVPMTADVSYFIVVDGYLGATGSYVLEITGGGGLPPPGTEPICTVVAPATPACVDRTGSGSIDITLVLMDLQGDPVDFTVLFDAGSGATPATLTATDSGTVAAFVPTHPGAMTGPANQVIGTTLPMTTVTWDFTADGLGLMACDNVSVTILPEDGTTLGAGPFSTCAMTFAVVANAAPACTLTAIDLGAFTFDLVDPDSASVDALFEYSVDGGSTWQLATPAGGSNPEAFASGTGLSWAWDGPADVGTCAMGVLGRITVDDGVMLPSRPTTCTSAPTNLGCTEPTCTITAPAAGVCAPSFPGGTVDIVVDLVDAEGDPLDLTVLFDAGAGMIPATLVATDSGTVTPFAPTNPGAVSGPSNQVVGAMPGTVTLSWDIVADGLGTSGCDAITITVYPEDGTTMGAGPFATCAQSAQVTANGAPSCVLTSFDEVKFDFDVADPDDTLITTLFEYSLDGGASWLLATPFDSSNPEFLSPGTGQTWNWDARADLPGCTMGVLGRVSVDDGVPATDRPGTCVSAPTDVLCCTIEETLDEAAIGLPIVRAGDTTGADDTLAPSMCASATGADHVYEFIPASSGAYDFTLCGVMAYDTVLGLFDSCPGGFELACDDNGCGSLQSSLLGVMLSAGIPVYVVIDGNSGATGAYELMIDSQSPPPCPFEESINEAVTPLPVMRMGDTTGAADDVPPPSCNPFAIEDHIYEFIPASTTTYTFDVCSPGLTMSITLYDACGPTAMELACLSSPPGCPPSLQINSFPLNAGMPVYIVIEGDMGTAPYTLNISPPVILRLPSRPGRRRG